MFYFSIMGFGFLLYLQWEAMLISYLARRTINLPFNSIPTLITKSDFKIAVIPGSSYEDAFKTATDPFWQKAWTERIEPYLDAYIFLRVINSSSSWKTVRLFQKNLLWICQKWSNIIKHNIWFIYSSIEKVVGSN